MIDPFGRTISYLRLSVTDRCDLRCTYCMPERMTFLPRADVLSIAELDRLASAFVRKGVRKIRLTGGEPLVRKDVLQLVERLSRFIGKAAINELSLTTNGTQLERHAEALASFGVKRINVSLDSLRPDVFTRITRGGSIERVIRGIDAARAAGIRIKINTVALRGDNVDDTVEIARWSHARGLDQTFIEVMPMGDVDADRIAQHVPMTEVRRRLERHWSLTDLAFSSGGPARYVRTNAGGTIGFITPLSHNFCGGCNRVRVTCTGQLYLCLGQSERADLRAALRSSPDDRALDQAIEAAVRRKPRAHDFIIAAGHGAAVDRQMSVTGG